jgi:hypothetical protein
VRLEHDRGHGITSVLEPAFEDAEVARYRARYLDTWADVVMEADGQGPVSLRCR